MIVRLPFSLQIPVGLTLAVLLTALCMSVALAFASIQRERVMLFESITRAQGLLSNQSRPLIQTDDVWALYKLLRETSAMLRSGRDGQVRFAVLDTDFHVLASSDPASLGVHAHLPLASQSQAPDAEQQWLSWPGHDVLRWTVPVRSDDEQIIGYLWIDVDPALFGPRWATTALLAGGVAFAILSMLIPLGWYVGRMLARPIVLIASCIEAIGSSETPFSKQCDRLPTSATPEVQRIADAVRRLASEMSARAQAEQRAMAAQRLAALGRMTAAVAHEINNPLAGLITNAQILRLAQTDETKRERALGLMERGLEQLRTVVASLLPHARVEGRALIADDLRDTLTLARAASGLYDIDSELQLPADEAPLPANAGLWRQVVLNLLLNALRAAAPAGWIRARFDVLPDRVVFQIANSGPRLDGRGLQEKFDAESGPDPRGFGLWICRELAVRHGGGFLSVEQVDFELPRLVINADARASAHLVFWLPPVGGDRHPT